MPPTLYRRSADVVFRKILDEHMLVPIRGNVADMQRVFALNPVAAFIWEALDGDRDLAAIVSRVVEVFAVDPAAAETDVRGFVAALQREGLIETVAAARARTSPTP